LGGAVCHGGRGNASAATSHTQSVKRQFRLSQQSRKPGAPVHGTLGFLLALIPGKRLKLDSLIDKNLF
jgi:hypothetical protein